MLLSFSLHNYKDRKKKDNRHTNNAILRQIGLSKYINIVIRTTLLHTVNRDANYFCF